MKTSIVSAVLVMILLSVFTTDASAHGGWRRAHYRHCHPQPVQVVYTAPVVRYCPPPRVRYCPPPRHVYRGRYAYNGGYVRHRYYAYNRY